MTATADSTGAITLSTSDGSDIIVGGTIDNTGLTAATTHATVSLSTTSTLGIKVGGNNAGNAGLTTGSTAASLGATLDAKTKGKKDTTIFFQADKGVDYGDLMGVMESLRAAGYLKVGLVGLESAVKK